MAEAALFFVAEELSMTVSELCLGMSLREFRWWLSFFRASHEGDA